MKIKRSFGVIRCVYLCVLTAYTILREIIPLQSFVGNGLVVAAVFGVGLLMIAASLWLDRDHATKANMGLFIAFLAVCSISTLINFRYEFLSNVKAIAWMALFFFLVYPCGFHHKDGQKKDITAIFVTSIVTLSIAVLISLPMYFFNLQYTYVTASQFDNVLAQGFHKEYLRLWGIFNDPNTAAVYSFVALLMSVYLFRKKKCLGTRIPLVVADVFIVLFVVLSGSRTARVAVIVACAWLAFYSVYTLLKKQKQLCRIAYSAISVLLAVVLSYGALTGIAYALPTVKRGVNSLCSPSVEKSVHLFYDDLYGATDMKITDGFFDEEEFIENEGTEQPEEDIVNRPDLEGKEDVSNGRFAKWGDYLKIFSTAPIFGASPRGISSYGKVNCPDTDVARYGYVSHNFLLEVLTGTGLAGFFIVLLMLINAAVIILRTTFKKQFAFKYLIHSCILLTLVCSSMFLSDLFFNLTFGGLAFFLALGFVNGENGYVDLDGLEKEEDGKKRILVYGPKDPIGGVEKIVYEYVKAITARHSDISFDFLQYGENFSMEKDLTELGCRVLYLPSRGKHFLRYKAALEKIFANTRYTAVWGNYSGLTNIDLLVLAKKYHVPVRIAHSHNSRLAWGSPIMKYVVYALHYYNKLFVTDYATDFWACSALAGEFMFPKATHSDMRIIVNAVDVDKFAPNKTLRERVREELGLEKDGVAIGNVARMCYQKNQEFLLNVTAELIKRAPNAKVLLVGEGELREELQAQAESLQITENVLFLGLRQDVPDLLQAMDVFVLTSRFEGLSVSAVEAQASGLPCVLPTTVSPATDVSGLVEFVSLEEPYAVWSEKILQQAQTKAENVKEKIIASGYEITSAAEVLYSLFITA